MPGFRAQAIQLAKGAGNKLQGAADYLTGTRRINNATDPTSALSMMRRKAMSGTRVSPSVPSPTANKIIR